MLVQVLTCSEYQAREGQALQHGGPTTCLQAGGRYCCCAAAVVVPLSGGITNCTTVSGTSDYTTISGIISEITNNCTIYSEISGVISGLSLI